MAEQFVALGLSAAGPAIDNYEKAVDPVKNKAKQLNQYRKGQRNQGQDRGYDDQYVNYNSSRRDSRRDSGYDRKGDYYDDYERRDSGRAKSAGRSSHGGRGLGDDRRRSGRRDYSSDSSSSISSRRAYKHRKSLGEQALAALGLGGVLGAEHEKNKDRRSSRERRSDRDRAYNRDRSRGYSDDRSQLPAGYLGYDERPGYGAGAVATRNGNYDNKSAITKRSTGGFDNHRGEKRGSSSSSSDSSSVISSSEDERRVKKMKGKEYITGALAAVATIHAAHGVYSSMEARDKRHESVLKGDMSVGEARKLKNKARLQDAAAIGIAALGIKGAYSEWQEVQESRQELSNQKKERAERHEKRLRKASKYGGSSNGGRSGGGRNRSEPDLHRGYRDE